MDISEIRVKEHFGLVSNNTSTSQFSFLVSPPKNRKSIEKRDIVCFDHPMYGEGCQVFAEVSEITSYEQVAGSTIGERVGKMLATSRIIGYTDTRNDKRSMLMQELLVPPNPGSRVYMPYAKFLEDVFSRRSDGGEYAQPLYLGKAEMMAASKETAVQEINFYLDAADLARKNTLIAAIDGAGKTYTSEVMIEEIADKASYPIIVLESRTEYETMEASSKPDLGCKANYQKEIISSSKSSADAIAKRVDRGRVIIVNAESMAFEEKNEYFASVLSELAKTMREKAGQPFLLIVEEAESLSYQVLQDIISTKKEIGIILISSHPIMLGEKILSQIQNFVIGKTYDAKDLAFFKNVFVGNEQSLSDLNTGEWMIGGLNVVRPTKIHVREICSRQK